MQTKPVRKALPAVRESQPARSRRKATRRGPEAAVRASQVRQAAQTEESHVEAEKAYYRVPDVRARLAEFCGTSRDADCTARFLVVDGNATHGLGFPGKENVSSRLNLDSLLTHGLDVFRSLWDTRSLLAFIEIDYQNQDFQHEAFINPAKVFDKLEPTFQAMSHELDSFGIPHISLMTGQGYHFLWKVNDKGESGRRLQEMADLTAPLEAKYRTDHPFTDETIPINKGRTNAGIGLVLEYLTHKVIRRARGQAELPIVVTGNYVGSGINGRESSSIDLSAYGDPLFLRYSRCAFSLYHKPYRQDTHLVCLPRSGPDWSELLSVRQHLGLAAEYAGTLKSVIPISNAGSGRLIDEYLSSDLRRYHVYFNSGWHDDTSDWPNGYDRLDLASVPPCVARPLSNPNDALMKPGNIQNVARVLISQHWHPRAVAGLIRSKYERDYGWGQAWLTYDAATRADFYVRLFSGLDATGSDNLADFNCVSHQEKGLCPKPWCGFNLADRREPLLKALQL
jgi:hypothetical protein